LIVLAAFAYFANDPFRKTLDYAVNYYQSLFVQETESIDDIIAKPSPAELAHNENYFGLGRLGNGDYAGAIIKFRSAAKLDPANLGYHYNLGIAYEKNGWHDNAIDELRFALKFQPDNPDILTWLGNAYFSKERWNDAAEAYDSAIKYGANDDRTFFNAAQVYMEIGKLTKAIRAIDSAIELNANDPDYYTISGIIKYNFEKYEEAIEDFEIARKIDPGDPEIDEWTRHTSEELREKRISKKVHRIGAQVDEYNQGLSGSRQRKLDEIFKRMEKLKEEVLDKQK